jgi:hypothetical protein
VQSYALDARSRELRFETFEEHCACASR